MLCWIVWSSVLASEKHWPVQGSGGVFSNSRLIVTKQARGLMQCGIQPETKVALWLTNRPEWLHILFAVAKIGAVLVPINTRFRTTDVEYVLRQSDTCMLITPIMLAPLGILIWYVS